MASFIKQENQTILWNTIQKVDLFHRVLSPTQKPVWFKDIIGIFYAEHRHLRLSRTDLENLNKKTIEYMVASLKNIQNQGLDKTQRGPGGLASKQLRNGYTQQQQHQQSKRVSFQEQLDIGSPINETPLDFRPEFSSNLEKKAIQSNQFITEFSNRQQEYDQMMVREVPPEPNFKEELADDVIKNMDELLEQQRKQRELELVSVAPPPPVPIVQPRVIRPTTSPIRSRKPLVILEDMNGSEESLVITPMLDLAPSPIPPQIDTQTIIYEIRELSSELKEMISMMKHFFGIQNTTIETTDINEK